MVRELRTTLATTGGHRLFGRVLRSGRGNPYHRHRRRHVRASRSSSPPLSLSPLHLLTHGEGAFPERLPRRASHLPQRAVLFCADRQSSSAARPAACRPPLSAPPAEVIRPPVYRTAEPLYADWYVQTPPSQRAHGRAARGLGSASAPALDVQGDGRRDRDGSGTLGRDRMGRRGGGRWEGGGLGG